VVAQAVIAAAGAGLHCRVDEYAPQADAGPTGAPVAGQLSEIVGKPLLLPPCGPHVADSAVAVQTLVGRLGWLGYAPAPLVQQGPQSRR